MRVVLTGDARRHTVYADLLARPPEGIEYDVRLTDWHAPLSGSRVRDLLLWKRRAARLRFLGTPDVALVPDWGAPVHAAGDLLRSPRPWVVDFEHVGTLVQYHYDKLYDPKVRRRVSRELARPECRALLPWTEAAAGSARAAFPEHADKVRVVYPAMAPRAPTPPRDPDAPLVLFVARRFEGKGGVEALEAFRVAREETGGKARMVFVCDTPPDVVAEYRGHGVEFLPPGQPREFLLKECFAKATAYLMPSQYDTFGMVYLEAFAHGVPVVGLDLYAMPELVDDGKDGFLVKGYSVQWVDADGSPNRGLSRWADLEPRLPLHERPRIVRDLADRLARLLADPALARRMGEAGREKVLRGRFSVEARNAALRDVYRGAFA